MKKTEKIYCLIQSLPLTDTEIFSHAENWLTLVRLLYTPKLIQEIREKKKLSLASVKEKMQNWTRTEEQELLITDGQNESRLHLVNGTFFQRHILTREVFTTKKNLLLSYTTKTMGEKGLFAYLRSYDEYLYHNIESPVVRQSFQHESEIEKLPKMKNEQGQVIVDCNQFSGYDIFYKGFCLTSCWRMYFSNEYNQILPIAILKDTQQVEQVTELEGSVLLVELYKDPFQWEHPRNQAFQRFFRDQTGIDQLAWNNGVGTLREPFIEYAYVDHVIQTVQYQNDQLQPTPKKRASHFVTRTFDILNQKYQEKRVKGFLNAQAYFPWVDEQGMKMMNYIVLNPQVTLDDGLSAYEFYIRDHLEIDVHDERYKEYTVSLNIYVPDEVLEKLPISQLKERMPDVHFGFIRRRKGKCWMTVKKGENHLKVYFIGAQEVAKHELEQA